MQRLATVGLSSDSSVSWRWIASGRIVADAPSRVWESFRDSTERGIDENRFEEARGVRAKGQNKGAAAATWRPRASAVAGSAIAEQVCTTAGQGCGKKSHMAG